MSTEIIWSSPAGNVSIWRRKPNQKLAVLAPSQLVEIGPVRRGTAGDERPVQSLKPDALCVVRDNDRVVILAKGDLHPEVASRR